MKLTGLILISSLLFAPLMCLSWEGNERPYEYDQYGNMQPNHISDLENRVKQLESSNRDLTQRIENLETLATQDHNFILALLTRDYESKNKLR